VWLYYVAVAELGEEFLVGFSSLGPTHWSIRNEPSRKMGFIPMLAVASAFQGKPRDSGEDRFSHRILKDVMAKARQRGYQELCLLVNDENTPAKRLYTRFGFTAVTKKDRRGNVRMHTALS